MESIKFLAITQDYEPIENVEFNNRNFAFDYMKKRFEKERNSLVENNENIIQDDLEEDKAFLFYEDNGEILGFAMYII